MAYTYLTQYNSPNFSKGRGGHKITSIVCHWWGAPSSNPSFNGVVNWLCNSASGVSAHEVITGTGRQVACVVNHSDTAWHAGNWTGNQTSIGLELDPRCRNEDYDVAAERIADLWKHYGKLPLQRHSDWVATACPGNYDLNRLAREAEAKLNPPPPPKPTPKPSAAVKLPKKLEFTAKLDNTSVWDLNSHPNWKAVTTLKKGAKFIAYAQINFNNSVYYVTEYSYGKGLKNGVNQVDLVPVPPPAPTPQPTPEPAPDKPVTEKPGYEDLDVRLTKLEALVETIVNFLTSIFNNFKRG